MERHHFVCITFKNTIIFNEFKVNKQMNLSEEKGSVQRVSIGKNRLLKRNLHRGTEWQFRIKNVLRKIVWTTFKYEGERIKEFQ